ncbi:MAG: porin family protein [Bacteroidota bacterium]
MKKILIIAAAIFTYTAAFSQEGTGNATKTFSIGPSIGFGHTGVRNMPGTDLFKPGWSAGVIVNYSTSEHIGFAGDVLFSSEGARAENNLGEETDLTLQYVRVPLKFAYFFGAFEDDFRPKVTIGPSMGFLLNADRDVEGVGRTDVTPSYETFDIGLNASVGFNLKMGEKMWLNTDLNYYTGFMPIYADQYNSNLGLKLGLAFGL